jgi:phosphoribosylamine--glycine ligase
VGSGGREHALAWRLAQSPNVQCVYVAPGNAGTAREPGLENLPITSIDELADFAARERIAYTVVGPEAPLAAGLVDQFRERKLKVFGPTRAAARLESSKEFAKAFMIRHNIPTARYRSFSDAQAAHAHIDAEGAPIVIKADGLAAGKGVVVAMTPDEAHHAVDLMLVDNRMEFVGNGFGHGTVHLWSEDCVLLATGSQPYLYANRRAMVPFGWYANPLPSTCATAWRVMLTRNFNPLATRKASP